MPSIYKGEWRDRMYIGSLEGSSRNVLTFATV